MKIYPYLNVGCGSRFLNNWTNVDFVSSNKDVVACNILKGLPFRDETFSVVYHSHLLEHLNPKQAESFLKECYRILEFGGILRVVVPDLEGIAQNYLQALLEARNENNELADANYNWAVLELLDQLVREKTGGDVLEYWKSPHLINQSTIEKRVGFEFQRIRKILLNDQNIESAKPKVNLKMRFKEAVLKSIFGISLETLQTAIFRNSGEVHKWMYDSYSLMKILEKSGFSNVCKVSALQSSIEGWTNFNWLDIEGGEIRKPDSIFFEALK